MRATGSGPWQAMQFSERIGRMSRLKTIFDGPEVAAAAVEANPAKASAITAEDSRRVAVPG